MEPEPEESPRLPSSENKTVVDNRLAAPSRKDSVDYNLQPCCGVALPVAGATTPAFDASMKQVASRILSGVARAS